VPDPKRESAMTADPFLPSVKTLPRLRQAAAGCKGCNLWRRGTQTVFGEGGAHSRVMFIGEQPGDREDRTGKPFVGPAGNLLDEALVQAGIDRKDVYVTNAVKHFSWEPDERGKRRIHKKPRVSEINACRPWLDAEISVVKPAILVCMGATAAQALFGKEFSVTRQRGTLMKTESAPHAMATIHPSAILRARDSETRNQQLRSFIGDLKKIAALLQEMDAAT
jgi:uracil-DNA glycosylase family protein